MAIYQTKHFAQAGLVDTLRSAGPFTVFAPTDAAFARLPAGTVEALLKDIPTLKSILTYHVVSGRVYAADVVKISSALTVQGTSIMIAMDMGAVQLNGSSNRSGKRYSNKQWCDARHRQRNSS
ncbi:hypothetical protein MASR2M48_08410 [Spirochaetota bacterium]